MMTPRDPNQVMIQIQQWWSRSSDDDPDRVMIQIQWWWFRSSDDDSDRVMIQIEWWSKSRWRWLEDGDDLKMKMMRTWRWPRWYREEDLCWKKLCRENTFLVKRECWWICNFRMYSFVFVMYCNLMFILGCICNVIESCHALMFRSGRFYNVKVVSIHCG